MIQPWEPIKIDFGPLTEAQYQVFKTGLPAWKYVLIAKMLRSTGLRIGELLRMEGRNYFVGGPDYWIAVRRSKKRKRDPGYEPLYLPPELGVELRDYIRGNRVTQSQRVFPITPRQVQRVFNQAGLDSIGRPVHPHEMRHLFVTYALEHGMSIEIAAKYVGHSDIKTTLNWYYELTADKRRAIGERMPT